MKKYKLLKDLPFAKAGDILSLERSQEYGYFKLCKDRSNPRSIELYEGIVEGFIDNFDDWFEEIKEPELPKEFFYIIRGKISKVEYLTFSLNENTKQEYINIIEEEKSVGNYFETKEEAEKHLEYLKAKAIVKQDAKGFKPNWNYKKERKYSGSWDFEDGTFSWSFAHTTKRPNIYFKSLEDILKSFEEHRKEWEIYLSYEQ